MVRFRIKLIAILILMLCVVRVNGQVAESISQSELEEYKTQAGMLVKYLEGTLNFLGDPLSTVQEKEVIINDSYSKIFRDDKIQVEDDLDENRDIPLNKDVQAYLKDVDFFFKHVRFKFDIQSVEPMTNEQGQTYFRVAMMRQIIGRTVSNDSVNSSRVRFLEINLDPFKKDLKIVSFYTTKINQREELRLWWTNMPQTWKDFFGHDKVVFDTLPLNRVEAISFDGIVTKRWKQISRQDTFFVMGPDTLPLSMSHLLYGRRPDTTIYIHDTRLLMVSDSIRSELTAVYQILTDLTKIQEINIAYKQQYTTLEPLSQLKELKTIDFSNTPIDDLSPLRNLNQLDAVYFSGTRVKSLDPLIYSVKIKEIYCFDTEVNDLSPLSGFRQLEKLYCFNSGINNIESLRGMKSLIALRFNNTVVSDLTPLQGMENLRLLDFSNTPVVNISPLSGLTGIQMLNMDHTGIRSLDPLKNLNALTIVQFSNTMVNDLSPLNGLKELKKVYCDKTSVSSTSALAFMRNKPGTLVIYESEELSAWWMGLPIYWRALLVEHAGTSANPDSEELHQIINITQLDLSGNSYLQNIQPLSRLTNLSKLSLARTAIEDISPLINLSELQEINLSQTRISDIAALQNILGLELLNIEDSRVEQLEALNGMARLKIIYADRSRVTMSEVLKFKKNQPNTTVIFQTEFLKNWWESLPVIWQELFASQAGFTGNPDAIQLQKVTDLTQIRIIDNIGFTDLEPLRNLPLLEVLEVRATMISSLQPVSELINLKQLEFPNNRISNINPVVKLTNLEVLNMENTSVTDISAISGLISLRVLNVAGTQIKNLKAIQGLINLEDLSVFNTRLKTLSPVELLPAISHIKCYNTKVKAKEIDALKSLKPELILLYY
jgi:Leucine-rich repeat (LRR) protein